MTKLIERNTTIPTRKSEVFSTAEDGQTSVEIHVLQGEREMAAFNKTLGKFQLVGIPPAPRGLPQVEVTFDIDANGILNVSAKDLGTGNEQKIEVRSGSGLSDDEINRMVRDAESHADDDRRMKDLAEAKNTAEQVAYSTEKSLKEHEDRLDEETRSDIRSKIDSVRQALDGEDAGEIRSRLEALREASFKLGEVVYQQAQQAQQSGPSGDGAAEGSEPAGDEEIVDAEVVDESGDRA
jgi:molecular chaperone DnaK